MVFHGYPLSANRFSTACTPTCGILPHVAFAQSPRARGQSQRAPPRVVSPSAFFCPPAPAWVVPRGTYDGAVGTRTRSPCGISPVLGYSARLGRTGANLCSTALAPVPPVVRSVAHRSARPSRASSAVSRTGQHARPARRTPGRGRAPWPSSRSRPVDASPGARWHESCYGVARVGPYGAVPHTGRVWAVVHTPWGACGCASALILARRLLDLASCGPRLSWHRSCKCGGGGGGLRGAIFSCQGSTVLSSRAAGRPSSFPPPSSQVIGRPARGKRPLLFAPRSPTRRQTPRKNGAI